MSECSLDGRRPIPDRHGVRGKQRNDSARGLPKKTVLFANAKNISFLCDYNAWIAPVLYGKEFFYTPGIYLERSPWG